MKIAILLPVRAGGSGGFVKHLSEVLPIWLQHTAVRRVSVFSPDGLIQGFEFLGDEFRRVSRDDYRTGFREMGKLVEDGDYDVALSTIPRPVAVRDCPVVTMVQNAEPIQTPSYPMPMLWRLRLWKLRRETVVACRNAARVIAVSNYVRKQLTERFGIPGAKTDVVYHGFDPSEPTMAARPDITLEDREFVFAAGSIVPYRGYEDIIRAAALLRQRRGKALNVVIAGEAHGLAPSTMRRLRRLARALDVERHTYWAGQLNRSEMTWCYRNCRLFIQTSRAEACPNIVLEALGHGCITVSCDQPPMPEFFDKNASYYSTGNADMLARRIGEALEMKEEAAEDRRAKARLRASQFSWERAASQTIEILAKTIEDHRIVESGKGPRIE
jgi:glycosyltransferase involved in cell wall biosynthesis